MALVSIIMPAYNAADFITETLDTVRRQSFSDWELLVVDDGSKDTTRDIVEALAALDGRIRLIRSPGNRGPAGARQLAIDHAGGRYVAFLDSDDLWLPDKLERQLVFMAEKAAVLSYTSVRRVNEDGSVTGRLMHAPPRLSYGQLLKNTAIVTSTVMVDRERSVPLRMVDAGYDDFCLWLSILRDGAIAYGLDEDLGRYRVRGGSVSSRPLRSIGWVWNIYRQVEGIPLIPSAWYLAHYGARAWLKRRRF
ncbi:MAG: glycosyltransferase family 2 protein [Devosia sp.]